MITTIEIVSLSSISIDLAIIGLLLYFYFIPSYQPALELSNGKQELKPRSIVILFFGITLIKLAFHKVFVGLGLSWVLFTHPSISINGALGSLISESSWYVLCGDYSIVIGIILFAMHTRKYYWDAESVYGQNYWMTQEKMMRWSEIKVVEFDCLSSIFRLKNAGGYTVCIPNSFTYDGLPQFFEQLRPYSENIRLKHITWQKIDKLIEKGKAHQALFSQ